MSAVSGPPALDAAAIQQLREEFRGEVLEPASPGYDEARRVHNAMIDRRPALIARCTGVADVIAALELAREAGLDVAVRGGGHSVPGYATCDGGIVIDLSPMRGIRVDPAGRTARVQAGVTWGQLDRETQQFGLAVTGGRVTTTGVSGLTLGSGSGWLERKLGYTVDSLISADLVTADGRLVHATEEHEPELLWGLRGGGGNFGIVTEFEFRLHEIGPIVLGGMLAFPRERAAEVGRIWREVTEGAPDDLGTGMALVTAPPEPFVPEDVRGRPICGVIVCWTGDAAEGERIIGPLRELGPALDMVQPMPYTAVQTLLDGGNPPGFRNYWKAENLRELDDQAIDTIVEQGNLIGSPLTQLVLIPLGGAVARVGEDDTALSHRDAAYAYHAIGMWVDAAEDDVHMRWARGVHEAMTPWQMPGVYLNFTSDQDDAHVRATYGAKWDRLVALKRRYDPDNLFRLNANIPPA